MADRKPTQFDSALEPGVEERVDLAAAAAGGRTVLQLDDHLADNPTPPIEIQGEITKMGRVAFFTLWGQRYHAAEITKGGVTAVVFTKIVEEEDGD